MNKDKKAQKERFLREAERQLLRKGFAAEEVDNELLRVQRDKLEICLVDGKGSVRFRPKDVTGAEAEALLRTVTQTVTEVGEYMRILERAPALQAAGLDEEYKILADFSDTVLAARIGEKGAEFVTWEWDFDRRGVHTGHYFMEDYTAAKWDFAVRAGLIDSQRLFSDEQLEAINQACEYLLMITMYGAMAQSESESISSNIRRGRQMHAKIGTLKIPCHRLYGYEKDADGKFYIIPEQAEIVREIYRRYLAGASQRNLKDWLEESQIKTVFGESKWTTSAVKGILMNEKYCGDVLFQKTFRSDVISKKTVKNTGQLPQYYMPDHHEAIVSREQYQAVQAEMARRNSLKSASKRAVTGRSCYTSKYALSDRLICGECGTLYRHCT